MDNNPMLDFATGDSKAFATGDSKAFAQLPADSTSGTIYDNLSTLSRSSSAEEMWRDDGELQSPKDPDIIVPENSSGIPAWLRLFLSSCRYSWWVRLIQLLLILDACYSVYQALTATSKIDVLAIGTWAPSCFLNETEAVYMSVRNESQSDIDFYACKFTLCRNQIVFNPLTLLAIVYWNSSRMLNTRGVSSFND